jgi:putative restriction endonuclease
VRGAGRHSEYSPATGFRYDGLFRVTDHWSAIGRSGFRIWRYRLVQLVTQDLEPYAPPQLPRGLKAPQSTVTIISRIRRSTPVAEAIKKLYEYTCQVCNIQLDVPGYIVAEAAHMRALGRPHCGPDTPDNILCLCPNHHSLFDAGGIYLTDNLEVRDHTNKLVGALTLRPIHRPDLQHVRYHRALWGH